MRRIAKRFFQATAGRMLLIVLAFFCSDLGAHFNLNVNLRIIHILRDGNEAVVMIRLPMPYLVADKLGPVRSDGMAEPAPFTQNVLEEGELMHYLDVESFIENPLALGQLVADGHSLSINAVPGTVKVNAVRAFPALNQSAFSTWDEAEQSFTGPAYDPSFVTGYVGDTIIDAQLSYVLASDDGLMELKSTLRPGLPEQEDTANLIVVTADGGTDVFRVRGLLDTPITVTQSALDASLSFIKSGVVHILEGLDHVLYVICLVLGATTVSLLFWRITGFTVGHSITLSLGFFGFVPKAQWFIALVELAIAASIILAAWFAIKQFNERFPMLLTGAMGLLHGLGFSFVLSEVLKIDSPNLWLSLLSFNIGVEFGQLLIVIVCGSILLLLYRVLPWNKRTLQIALAMPCIALASIWIGQRLTTLIEAIA